MTGTVSRVTATLLEAGVSACRTGIYSCSLWPSITSAKFGKAGSATRFPYPRARRYPVARATVCPLGARSLRRRNTASTSFQSAESLSALEACRPGRGGREAWAGGRRFGWGTRRGSLHPAAPGRKPSTARASTFSSTTDGVTAKWTAQIASGWASVAVVVVSWTNNRSRARAYANSKPRTGGSAAREGS